MLILFEVIKIIFFLFTIFLATVLVKGELFLSASLLGILHKVLFPGYMVLIGILFGYVLALLGEKSDASEEERTILYTRMFIIGIALGTIFSLTYIFIL